MVYASKADMQQRFGETEIVELTDRNGTGVTDDGVLNRALNDADALINGYLAGKYSLPMVTVPPVVAGWAADIARYKLWASRASEEVRKRYEDALKQLELVAKGIVVLPPDSNGTPPVAGLAVDHYSNTRVFDEAGLAGY